MYIKIPIDINFTANKKSYRLVLNKRFMVLYEIFESEDDKELFYFEF